MNIIKKIQPYILASGILASVLTGTGCASSQSQFGGNVDPRIELSEKAMKILDIDNPSMLYFLPTGYISSNSHRPSLNLFAGLYAGTIDVKRIENKIEKDNVTIIEHHLDGYYSYFDNPESLNKISYEADKNNDKIISEEEFKNLEDIMHQNYDKYAEKNKYFFY